jgi:hypothetical protein
VLAGAASLACALPSAAAHAEGSQPIRQALSVLNPGGRAAQLVRRVTLQQLAAALKTTPAELTTQIQTQLGGAGGNVELGELTLDPRATVGELIDGLAAKGVSADQIERLINGLLAPATDTAEGLRSVTETLLSDITENGQLAALANELGVPASLLEAARFVPSTVEGLAAALDAPASELSSLLSRAESAAEPATMLAVDHLEGRAAGTRFIVGSPGAPGASGGVTLTTVSSTSVAPHAGVLPSTSRALPSGAFSIVSIRVTRSGMIVETVSVPRPGRVAVKASVTTKAAKNSRRGRQVVRRMARRTATVASSVIETGAGVRTITLRLRASALRAPRIAVTLATTYTPTGGAPNTIRRLVIVRQVRATKHRRRR